MSVPGVGNHFIVHHALDPVAEAALRIRLQARLANFDVVYPYLAILVSFGYGADKLLQLSMRWLCPWYGEKH